VVVVGGAEAWLVGGALAAAKVPVVIDPYQAGPSSFDQVHARADNGALLRAAGVTVAIHGPSAHQARSLRFIAGNAVRGGMSHVDALAAITSVPASLLGLKDRGRIEVGAHADLAVWTGDPLDIPARLAMLTIGGVEVELISRQTELVDRWRDLGPVLPAP
jgi:imidazolonepropionase-like amidohydrolase